MSYHDEQAGVTWRVGPGTPALFLDIDGPVNAFDPVDRGGWDTIEEAVVHGYRITWSPDLIRNLIELVEEFGVDLLLASTWVEFREEILDTLRLPDIPAAFPPQRARHMYQDAKRVVVDEAHAAGRCVIWADDTAIPRPLDGSYWEPDGTGGFLLLRIDDNPGITPFHIGLLRGFLTANREANALCPAG